MFKFSRNTDWEFDVESVSIIKDAKSLTKRASAKDLLRYQKTANQTDVHVIALGAFEGTGFNRNLDGFGLSDCIKNAHYFSDADRAFNRNHKNKPEDPKFGNIKAAACNVPMFRIELIVGHDNDKCADILDEIEKKGQANYSMASKQAYDVCSWCKHKAHTDKDRCDCIPNKLGEINKQGEMCGMMNPDPHWFELSHVKRQADRIGMSLAKVASNDLRPMSTTDFMGLYPGFTPPTDDLFLSKKASDKRFFVKKLSAFEKRLDAVATGVENNPYLAKEAPKMNLSSKVAWEIMDILRNQDPAKLFKAAADKGIIFSPEDFCKYVFGDRIKAASIAGIKTHLPDIYQTIEKSAGAAVNNERYEPLELGDVSFEAKQLLNKISEDQSLFSGPVRGRIIRVTVSSVDNQAKLTKTSEDKSSDVFDKAMAVEYASYKLAMLNYLDQQNKLDEDLLWNVLIQNRG